MSPATTARRTSLSLLEELSLHGDTPSRPLTIHNELRFTGALDADRLGAAIAVAVAAHPMTRARLAGRRRFLRPPYWEIGECGAEAALGTTRCDDERELAATRAAFFSRPIDVTKAPALRFLLVNRPGGDSLFLSISHVITDGVGTSRLLRSLGCAYAGRPDPAPAIDPIAARDLRALLAWRGEARPRPAARGRSRADVPPPMVAEGGRDEPGYGFCHRILSAEQRSGLEPRIHGPSATYNDLLLAALHRAIDTWNRERNQPASTVAVFMPFSMRPPECYNDLVANLTLGGAVVTSPAQRASAASLMAAVMDQTGAIKAGGGLATHLDLPRWAVRLLPIVLPRAHLVLGQRTRRNAVLTYFGKIDREVPDFGPDPGALVEVWGSPPTGLLGLGLGANIFRGRLHMALRYRRSLFDEHAAGRFMDILLDRLTELGSADRAVAPREASGALSMPAVHST